jgi:hypothetical protein
MTQSDIDTFLNSLLALFSEWRSQGKPYSETAWGNTLPYKTHFNGTIPCPISVALIAKKLRYPAIQLAKLGYPNKTSWFGFDIVEGIALSRYFDVPLDFMLGVISGYKYYRQAIKSCKAYCESNTLPPKVVKKKVENGKYTIADMKAFAQGTVAGKMIKAIASQPGAQYLW